MENDVVLPYTSLGQKILDDAAAYMRARDDVDLELFEIIESHFMKPTSDQRIDLAWNDLVKLVEKRSES